MPIPGSPTKMARDISEGYLSLTPAGLKAYNAADFKTILHHLAVVTRELRQESIAPDDAAAAKKRNMKLARLSQAETILRSHCKKHRVPI